MIDAETNITTQEGSYDSLDSVNKVEKIPIRFSPAQGPAITGNMTYSTHHESLTKSRQEEARESRLSRNARGVSFDKVVVREYTVSVGDNPAVSRGCPLSIGWEPVAHTEYNFDDYEDHKPAKRPNNDMFMHFSVRHKILKNGGYTPKEITKLAIDVYDARSKRHKTVTKLNKNNDKWDEKKEIFRHRVIDVLSKVHPKIKKERMEEERLLSYHLDGTQ